MCELSSSPASSAIDVGKDDSDSVEHGELAIRSSSACAVNSLQAMTALPRASSTSDETELSVCATSSVVASTSSPSLEPGQIFCSGTQVALIDHQRAERQELNSEMGSARLSFLEPIHNTGSFNNCVLYSIDQFRRVTFESSVAHAAELREQLAAAVEPLWNEPFLGFDTFSACARDDRKEDGSWVSAARYKELLLGNTTLGIVELELCSRVFSLYIEIYLADGWNSRRLQRATLLCARHGTPSSDPVCLLYRSTKDGEGNISGHYELLRANHRRKPFPSLHSQDVEAKILKRDMDRKHATLVDVFNAWALLRVKRLMKSEVKQRVPQAKQRASHNDVDARLAGGIARRSGTSGAEAVLRVQEQVQLKNSELEVVLAESSRMAADAAAAAHFEAACEASILETSAALAVQEANEAAQFELACAASVASERQELLERRLLACATKGALLKWRAFITRCSEAFFYALRIQRCYLELSSRRTARSLQRALRMWQSRARRAHRLTTLTPVLEGDLQVSEFLTSPEENEQGHIRIEADLVEPIAANRGNGARCNGRHPHNGFIDSICPLCQENTGRCDCGYLFPCLNCTQSDAHTEVQVQTATHTPEVSELVNTDCGECERAEQRTEFDRLMHERLDMMAKPEHVHCHSCGALARVEYNGRCSACDGLPHGVAATIQGAWRKFIGQKAARLAQVHATSPTDADQGVRKFRKPLSYPPGLGIGPPKGVPPTVNGPPSGPATPVQHSPPDHRHRWRRALNFGCVNCDVSLYYYCTECGATYCYSCSQVELPRYGPMKPGPVSSSSTPLDTIVLESSTPLTAIDICTGCGGLALAARNVGFYHSLLVEVNERCALTLAKNGFINVLVKRLQDVDFSPYKGVHLLTGGLPCQPWSTGGVDTGEADVRNLWAEAVRSVREASPRAFLFEMVTGFTRPKFQNFFNSILDRLSALGYSCEIHHVNAKDFGIPQSRKRLLMIGTITTARVVVPEPQSETTVGTMMLSLGPPEAQRADRHEESGIASSYEGHRPSSMDKPSKTLRAGCNGPGGGSNTVMLSDGSVRYFTVREMARLQSFPDTYVFDPVWSHAVKEIGNACPPAMVQPWLYQLLLLCQGTPLSSGDKEEEGASEGGGEAKGDGFTATVCSIHGPRQLTRPSHYHTWRYGICPNPNCFDSLFCHCVECGATYCETCNIGRRPRYGPARPGPVDTPSVQQTDSIVESSISGSNSGTIPITDSPRAQRDAVIASLDLPQERALLRTGFNFLLTTLWSERVTELVLSLSRAACDVALVATRNLINDWSATESRSTLCEYRDAALSWLDARRWFPSAALCDVVSRESPSHSLVETADTQRHAILERLATLKRKLGKASSRKASATQKAAAYVATSPPTIRILQRVGPPSRPVQIRKPDTKEEDGDTFAERTVKYLETRNRIFGVVNTSAHSLATARRIAKSSVVNSNSRPRLPTVAEASVDDRPLPEAAPMKTIAMARCTTIQRTVYMLALTGDKGRQVVTTRRGSAYYLFAEQPAPIATEFIRKAWLMKRTDKGELGTRWQRESRKPAFGVSLFNAHLYRALQRGQQEFTVAELESFQIESLLPHSFVKVGPHFYVQAGKRIPAFTMETTYSTLIRAAREFLDGYRYAAKLKDDIHAASIDRATGDANGNFTYRVGNTYIIVALTLWRVELQSLSPSDMRVGEVSHLPWVQFEDDVRNEITRNVCAFRLAPCAAFASTCVWRHCTHVAFCSMMGLETTPQDAEKSSADAGGRAQVNTVQDPRVAFQGKLMWLLVYNDVRIYDDVCEGRKTLETRFNVAPYCHIRPGHLVLNLLKVPGVRRMPHWSVVKGLDYSTSFAQACEGQQLDSILPRCHSICIRAWPSSREGSEDVRYCKLGESDSLSTEFYFFLQSLQIAHFGAKARVFVENSSALHPHTGLPAISIKCIVTPLTQEAAAAALQRLQDATNPHFGLQTQPVASVVWDQRLSREAVETRFAHMYRRVCPHRRMWVRKFETFDPQRVLLMTLEPLQSSLSPSASYVFELLQSYPSPVVFSIRPPEGSLTQFLRGAGAHESSSTAGRLSRWVDYPEMDHFAEVQGLFDVFVLLREWLLLRPPRSPAAFLLSSESVPLVQPDVDFFPSVFSAVGTSAKSYLFCRFVALWRSRGRRHMTGYQLRNYHNMRKRGDWTGIHRLLSTSPRSTRDQLLKWCEVHESRAVSRCAFRLTHILVRRAHGWRSLCRLLKGFTSTPAPARPRLLLQYRKEGHSPMVRVSVLDPGSCFQVPRVQLQLSLATSSTGMVQVNATTRVRPNSILRHRLWPHTKCLNKMGYVLGLMASEAMWARARLKFQGVADFYSSYKVASLLCFPALTAYHPFAKPGGSLLGLHMAGFRVAAADIDERLGKVRKLLNALGPPLATIECVDAFAADAMQRTIATHDAMCKDGELPADVGLIIMTPNCQTTCSLGSINRSEARTDADSVNRHLLDAYSLCRRFYKELGIHFFVETTGGAKKLLSAASMGTYASEIREMHCASESDGLHIVLHPPGSPLIVDSALKEMYSELKSCTCTGSQKPMPSLTPDGEPFYCCEGCVACMAGNAPGLDLRRRCEIAQIPQELVHNNVEANNALTRNIGELMGLQSHMYILRNRLGVPAISADEGKDVKLDQWRRHLLQAVGSNPYDHGLPLPVREAIVILAPLSMLGSLIVSGNGLLIRVPVRGEGTLVQEVANGLGELHPLARCRASQLSFAGDALKFNIASLVFVSRTIDNAFFSALDKGGHPHGLYVTLATEFACSCVAEDLLALELATCLGIDDSIGAAARAARTCVSARQGGGEAGGPLQNAAQSFRGQGQVFYNTDTNLEGNSARCGTRASQIFYICLDSDGPVLFVHDRVKDNKCFVPGGHQEPNDSDAREAAWREGREETGATVPLEALQHSWAGDGTDGYEWILTDFAVLLDKCCVPLLRCAEPSKHCNGRWVTISQLSALETAQLHDEQLVERATRAIQVALSTHSVKGQRAPNLPRAILNATAARLASLIQQTFRSRRPRLPQGDVMLLEGASSASSSDLQIASLKLVRKVCASLHLQALLSAVCGGLRLVSANLQVEVPQEGPSGNRARDRFMRKAQKAVRTATSSPAPIKPPAPGLDSILRASSDALHYAAASEDPRTAAVATSMVHAIAQHALRADYESKQSNARVKLSSFLRSAYVKGDGLKKLVKNAQSAGFKDADTRTVRKLISTMTARVGQVNVATALHQEVFKRHPERARAFEVKRRNQAAATLQLHWRAHLVRARVAEVHAREFIDQATGHYEQRDKAAGVDSTAECFVNMDHHASISTSFLPEMMLDWDAVHAITCKRDPSQALRDCMLIHSKEVFGDCRWQVSPGEMPTIIDADGDVVVWYEEETVRWRHVHVVARGKALAQLKRTLDAVSDSRDMEDPSLMLQSTVKFLEHQQAKRRASSAALERQYRSKVSAHLKRTAERLSFLQEREAHYTQLASLGDPNAVSLLTRIQGRLYSAARDSAGHVNSVSSLKAGKSTPCWLRGVRAVNAKGERREVHQVMADTGASTYLMGADMFYELARTGHAVRNSGTATSIREISGIGGVVLVLFHASVQLLIGEHVVHLEDIPVIAGHRGLLLGNDVCKSTRAILDHLEGRDAYGRYDGTFSVRNPEGTKVLGSLRFVTTQEDTYDDGDCHYPSVHAAQQAGAAGAAVAYAAKDQTIKGWREAFITARIPSCARFAKTVAILPLDDERADELGVFIAPALCEPDADGNVTFKCINTSTQRVPISQGTALARFVLDPTVEDRDMEFSTDEIMRLINIDPDATEDDLIYIRAMVAERRRLFKSTIGWAHMFKADIETPSVDSGQVDPPSSRNMRYSPTELEALRKNIDKMLKEHIIERTRSPYNALPLLIKKPDGEYRTVLDFRRLNAVVVKNSYPLPSIEHNLASLGRSELFTTADLLQGFYQLELSASSKLKTAFGTPFGQFAFVRLPMGLTSSPGIFMQAVDSALRGLPPEMCLAYIDDIIIPSSGGMASHMKDVSTVFGRLIEAGFTVRCDKVHIGKREVPYLGFMVSKAGTTPLPQRTSAIFAFAYDQMLADVKAAGRFAGMIGFYSRFLPHLHVTLKPFHELKRKALSGVQRRDMITALRFRAAFVALQYHLAQCVALARPDYSKVFHLMVDAAASCGGGGALGQCEDEEDLKTMRPLALLSYSFVDEQYRYDVRAQECYAIYRAYKEWRPFLWGSSSCTHSDHQSLKWLMSTPHRAGELTAKWQAYLQQFDMQIDYFPGRQNVVGDFFSRVWPLSRLIAARGGGGNKGGNVDIPQPHSSLSTATLPAATDEDESTGDCVLVSVGTQVDIPLQGLPKRTAVVMSNVRKPRSLVHSGLRVARDGYVTFDVKAFRRFASQPGADAAVVFLKLQGGQLDMLVEVFEGRPSLPKVREKSFAPLRALLYDYVMSYFRGDTANSLSRALMYNADKYRPSVTGVTTMFVAVVIGEVDLPNESTLGNAAFVPYTAELPFGFHDESELWFTRLLLEDLRKVRKPMHGWRQAQGSAVKQLKSALFPAAHVFKVHSDPTPLPLFDKAQPSVPCWVDNMEEATRVGAAMEALLGTTGGIAALDLEGFLGGRNRRDEHISLMQLAVQGYQDLKPITVVLDIHKCPDILNSNSAICQILTREDTVKVLHSGKGDSLSLHSLFGITLVSVFDTAVADSILSSNTLNSDRGLGVVVNRWTGHTLPLKGQIEFRHDYDIFCERPLPSRLAVYAYGDVLHCVELYLTQRTALEARGLYNLAVAVSRQRLEPVPSEPLAVLLAVMDGSRVFVMKSQEGAASQVPRLALTPQGEVRRTVRRVWPECMGVPPQPLKQPLARAGKAVRVGEVLICIARVDSCPLLLDSVREQKAESCASIELIDVVTGEDSLRGDSTLQYLHIMAYHRVAACVNVAVGSQLTGERGALVLHDDSKILLIMNRKHKAELPSMAAKINLTVRETAINSLAHTMGSALVKGGEFSHHMPITAAIISEALEKVVLLCKEGNTSYFECRLPPHFLSTYASSFHAARRYTCGFSPVATFIDKYPEFRISPLEQAGDLLGSFDIMAYGLLRQYQAGRPAQHNDRSIQPASALGQVNMARESGYQLAGDEFVGCVLVVFANLCSRQVAWANANTVPGRIQPSRKAPPSAAELKRAQFDDPALQPLIIELSRKDKSHLRLPTDASSMDEAEVQVATPLEQPQSEQELDERHVMNHDLRDGVLYRGHCVVVPYRFRQAVITACHDYVGHLGVARVFPVVIRRYYWGTVKEMRRDVSLHIGSCNVCASIKVPRHHAGERHLLETGRTPWEVVGVDQYSTGVKAASGNTDTVSFVDFLSHGVVCEPCQDTLNSEGYAQLTLRTLIRRKGVPKKFLSDRGSIFISKLVKAIGRIIDAEIKASTAYHHQTVGIVERWHSVLGAMIRAFRFAERSDDWDLFLPLLELAYNATTHALTGYSAFYVESGRHPRLPSELFSEPSSTTTVSEFIKEFIEGLNLTWDSLVRKLNLLAISAKDRMDVRRDVTLKYQEGDKVLLVKGRFVDGVLPKAEFPTDGPYIIAKVLPKDNYLLRSRGAMRIHEVVSVDRLLPVNERHIRKLDGAPHDRNNGQWPVKAIIDCKVTTAVNNYLQYPKGTPRLKYLIWWLDYPRSYGTWRESEHLVNVAELVIAYHSKHGYPEGFAPEPLHVERSDIVTQPPVTSAAKRVPHFRHHPQRLPSTPEVTSNPPAVAEIEATVEPEDTLIPRARDVTDKYPKGSRIQIRTNSETEWHSGVVIDTWIYTPKAANKWHLRDRRIKFQFDDAKRWGPSPFIYDLGEGHYSYRLEPGSTAIAPGPSNHPSPAAAPAPAAPPPPRAVRHSPRLSQVNLASPDGCTEAPPSPPPSPAHPPEVARVVTVYAAQDQVIDGLSATGIGARIVSCAHFARTVQILPLSDDRESWLGLSIVPSICDVDSEGYLTISCFNPTAQSAVITQWTTLASVDSEILPAEIPRAPEPLVMEHPPNSPPPSPPLASILEVVSDFACSVVCGLTFGYFFSAEPLPPPPLPLLPTTPPTQRLARSPARRAASVSTSPPPVHRATNPRARPAPIPGVGTFRLSPRWREHTLEVLELLKQSFDSSTGRGSAQGASRRTGILWYQSLSTSTASTWEFTITLNSLTAHLFVGDRGTILHPPSRDSDTLYWQIHDELLAMERRIRQAVISACDSSALDGLILGGAQVTSSSAFARREQHFDNPDIAELLVTLTLEGDGSIGIHPLNGPAFHVPQAAGDAYILHGAAGLTDARHSVTVGALGRYSITFRFVREIQRTRAVYVTGTRPDTQLVVHDTGASVSLMGADRFRRTSRSGRAVLYNPGASSSTPDVGGAAPTGLFPSPPPSPPIHESLLCSPCCDSLYDCCPVCDQLYCTGCQNRYLFYSVMRLHGQIQADIGFVAGRFRRVQVAVGMTSHTYLNSISLCGCRREYFELTDTTALLPIRLPEPVSGPLPLAEPDEFVAAVPPFQQP